MTIKKISPYIYPGLDLVPGDIDIANFLASVGMHHNVKVEDIMSPCRDQHLVELRQCVWYVLYHREKKNYSRLGRFFNRDHATVLYGVNKVNNLISVGDYQMQKVLNSILLIYKNCKHYGQAKDD